MSPSPPSSPSRQRHVLAALPGANSPEEGDPAMAPGLDVSPPVLDLRRAPPLAGRVNRDHRDQVRRRLDFSDDAIAEFQQAARHFRFFDLGERRLSTLLRELGEIVGNRGDKTNDDIAEELFTKIKEAKDIDSYNYFDLRVQNFLTGLDSETYNAFMNRLFYYHPEERDTVADIFSIIGTVEPLSEIVTKLDDENQIAFFERLIDLAGIRTILEDSRNTLRKVRSQATVNEILVKVLKQVPIICVCERDQLLASELFAEFLPIDEFVSCFNEAFSEESELPEKGYFAIFIANVFYKLIPQSGGIGQLHKDAVGDFLTRRNIKFVMKFYNLFKYSYELKAARLPIPRVWKDYYFPQAVEKALPLIDAKERHDLLAQYFERAQLPDFQMWSDYFLSGYFTQGMSHQQKVMAHRVLFRKAITQSSEVVFRFNAGYFEKNGLEGFAGAYVLTAKKYARGLSPQYRERLEEHVKRLFYNKAIASATIQWVKTVADSQDDKDLDAKRSFISLLTANWEIRADIKEKLEAYEVLKKLELTFSKEDEAALKKARHPLKRVVKEVQSISEEVQIPRKFRVGARASDVRALPGYQSFSLLSARDRSQYSKLMDVTNHSLNLEEVRPNLIIPGADSISGLFALPDYDKSKEFTIEAAEGIQTTVVASFDNFQEIYHYLRGKYLSEDLEALEGDDMKLTRGVTSVLGKVARSAIFGMPAEQTDRYDQIKHNLGAAAFAMLEMDLDRSVDDDQKTKKLEQMFLFLAELGNSDLCSAPYERDLPEYVQDLFGSYLNTHRRSGKEKLMHLVKGAFFDVVRKSTQQAFAKINARQNNPVVYERHNYNIFLLTLNQKLFQTHVPTEVIYKDSFLAHTRGHCAEVNLSEAAREFFDLYNLPALIKAVREQLSKGFADGYFSYEADPLHTFIKKHCYLDKKVDERLEQALKPNNKGEYDLELMVIIKLLQWAKIIIIPKQRYTREMLDRLASMR